MKKNLSLIISFIGIVSIAGGILLIKTLENPNDFILTLSYICIGCWLWYFRAWYGEFCYYKNNSKQSRNKKNKWILFVKMKEISLYLIVQKRDLVTGLFVMAEDKGLYKRSIP